MHPQRATELGIRCRVSVLRAGALWVSNIKVILPMLRICNLKNLSHENTVRIFELALASTIIGIACRIPSD